MAAAGVRRVRFSGVILTLCAAVLFAMGYYLLFVALSWVMPGWLPADWQFAPRGEALPIAAAQHSPIGLASLYLLVFGVIGGLAGLWMVVFGRRNWLLTVPLVLLFLIFIVVGAWVSLDPDGFSLALSKIGG